MTINEMRELFDRTGANYMTALINIYQSKDTLIRKQESHFKVFSTNYDAIQIIEIIGGTVYSIYGIGSIIRYHDRLEVYTYEEADFNKFEELFCTTTDSIVKTKLNVVS